MVLFYTNAGSLINKLDELKISLPIYNPDILCISESHYSQEIENSEVDIVGYRCFRADRGFKTKGKDELATGVQVRVMVSALVPPVVGDLSSM